MKYLFLIPFIIIFISSLNHEAMGEIEFIRDVKPILEHNCVSCHREDNAKGKVRLDTKKSIKKYSKK